MHHGLIKTLRNIVEEARVPKSSIVEKVEGIRPDDCTRPGDFVVLDFAEGGRHLVINGVVTTVYRNSVLLRWQPSHEPMICGHTGGGHEVQD